MKSLLVALLTTSVVLAAVPRAYVSLASVNAGIGYQAYSSRRDGTHPAWFGVGLQAIEGTWFVTERLGLGFRLLDIAYSPPWPSVLPLMFALCAPTVSWVIDRGAPGIDYWCLAVMPVMPYQELSGSDRMLASSVALDYGYVPQPPWPLEGRMRLSVSVLDWSRRMVSWQASAGFRAGLGWWFTREEE